MYRERVVRDLKRSDIDPKDRLTKSQFMLRKLLMYSLATYLNRKTLRCDPSHDTLADEVDSTRKTVRSAIDAMEQDGLIAITRRPNRPHQYQLLFLEVGKTDTEVGNPEQEVGNPLGQVGNRVGKSAPNDPRTPRTPISEPLKRTPSLEPLALERETTEVKRPKVLFNYKTGVLEVEDGDGKMNPIPSMISESRTA